LNPEFLDVDDVLEIHDMQLAEHGGLEGLRDRSLLESAVAQPIAQFGGQFLHADIFEMAATLHFSLVLNHAFLDGNKRTAVLAALTFLAINGHPIEEPHEALTHITLEVAAGRADKQAVADTLRYLAERPL
jgi:death on curing protein